MNRQAECRWCGLTHGPTCSMVKAIEFHEDGETVKRVEFKGAADYSIQQTPSPQYLPQLGPFLGPFPGQLYSNGSTQPVKPYVPSHLGWPTHIISYGDGTCSVCQTTGVCNCVLPYTSSTGAIQS